MENPGRVDDGRKIARIGIEENILAILDTADLHRDSQDANDDRFDFLEAVRFDSIVPDNGNPPTKKMSKSLELLMASYQLLSELDKRFPWVYISASDSGDSRDLVVTDEAWLPFDLSSETVSNARELRRADVKTYSRLIDVNFVGNLLLFQYLVSVLERDFAPRNIMYKETSNWNLLKERLLKVLLGSRRISYKALIKDCLSTFCGLYMDHGGASDSPLLPDGSAESSHECATFVKTALPELRKSTRVSMQKLLTLIMELDMSRKQADIEGQTTRADGVRTPLVEVILDELTYDRYMLSPFLQVFDEPRWKLEIIMQFFRKYIPKPSVRTRRSNGSSEDSSLNGVLKCFSNTTST